MNGADERRSESGIDPIRSSFLESKLEFPNVLPSHVLKNTLNPQNIHVNAAHRSHCLVAEEYNSISILSARLNYATLEYGIQKKRDIRY
jgi:hypothetical protein